MIVIKIKKNNLNVQAERKKNKLVKFFSFVHSLVLLLKQEEKLVINLYLVF